MTWFAIHEIATGRLESVGTVIADDAALAARGFAKKALAAKPEDDEEWDEAALLFKKKPTIPIDNRRKDLLTKPSPAWNDQDRSDALKLILENVVGTLRGEE